MRLCLEDRDFEIAQLGMALIGQVIQLRGLRIPCQCLHMKCTIAAMNGRREQNSSESPSRWPAPTKTKSCERDGSKVKSYVMHSACIGGTDVHLPCSDRCHYRNAFCTLHPHEAAFSITSNAVS